MTLVIDVEAGREQTKGLNHSLYDVHKIRCRIARWIQKALEEVTHDYEDLRDLREAKEESKGQEGVPLERVVSDLGL